MGDQKTGPQTPEPSGTNLKVKSALVVLQRVIGQWFG